MEEENVKETGVEEEEAYPNEDEEVYVYSTTTEELRSLLSNNDRAGLKEVFETVPDIDIAEAAEKLDIKELVQLFVEAPTENGANLFDELSQERKEELVGAMTDKELIPILIAQSTDDLADMLSSDMPANLSSRVLRSISKDMREDVNRLLKYKPETAGAIMTTDYLELKDNLTVKEAIEEIRERGRDAETIYTVFVRNKKRKFIGTIDLDDLIFAKETDKIETILNKDAPTVGVNADQEEIANLFRRYDLNAIAVLNADDCLCGIVTVDDAIDVMTDEASEDIESMSAVGKLEYPYLETSPWQMAKKCVPWILVLLVLGTFSSLILSSFQEQISLLPVLASFITVVAGTSGNAGGQTINLVARGMALKEFGPKDTGKILWRETKSAIIIAVLVSVFSFFWFTVEQYTGIIHNTQADLVNNTEWATIWNGQCWTWPFAVEVLRVSGVVSLSLLITVFLSKIVAVLLPLGAAALKKDQAVVAQPLLTTFIDITSLLIFFVIAEVLILQLI